MRFVISVNKLLSLKEVVICVIKNSGLSFLFESFLLDQGFPNWGTCTALGFSRGTLLCERIFLFKLDSVSGRNNRLKCLEFSNPLDCNYVKQDN